MQDIWHNLWEGLATSSRLDQINFVLGVGGVWLMTRRNLWAFPLCLAGAVAQGILYLRIRFPADALLQVFFFVTLAWGWWHWVHDKGAAPELPVTVLPGKARLILLIAASVGTAIWALTVGPWMKAAMPWRDAFIAVFSVVGQVLQARKNLENWPVWTVVNVVAVISYWSAGAPFTSVLFLIYLILGVMGWVGWTRAMRRQNHG